MYIQYCNSMYCIVYIHKYVETFIQYIEITILVYPLTSTRRNFGRILHYFYSITVRIFRPSDRTVGRPPGPGPRFEPGPGGPEVGTLQRQTTTPH